MKGKILITFLCVFCLQISAEESFDYSSREDVREYVKELSANHDFDIDELYALLTSAVYQEKVVRIMNRQPEGTMTWSRYKKMMVSDSRISGGKDGFLPDLISVIIIFGGFSLFDTSSDRTLMVS